MRSRKGLQHRSDKEASFIPTREEVAESRELVEEIRRRSMSWDEIENIKRGTENEVSKLKPRT